MIHLPIRKTKRRAIALLKNSIIEKALVLIYHRVIDIENDPQQLSVSISNFEKQLISLKKQYRIISLQQLVSDLERGKVVNKSVAITFDDGYFDNNSYALPVLEKLQIPATFFISTNYIEQAVEFWWDKLESIILLNESLPSELELNVNNKRFVWRNCIEHKEQLYSDILAILKESPIAVIKRTLEQLLAWSGKEYHPRQNFKPLSQAEIIEMSKSSLFEIGSHTMSHCRLSNETIETQRDEIATSKIILEQLLNKKIQSFSYPFGSFKDYSDFTPGIVKNQGYNCGISNNQNSVTKNSDIYEIPRFLVRNWNSTEFEYNIKNMFRFGSE